MKCPHCGFEFEEQAHCPNCGKAPGKPGHSKMYYEESAVTQTAEQPEVRQGDTQVFTPESRPTQPTVIEQPVNQPEQAAAVQEHSAPEPPITVQEQKPQTEPPKTPEKSAKKKKKGILFPLLVALFFFFMVPGNPIAIVIELYCAVLIVIRLFSRRSAAKNKLNN